MEHTVKTTALHDWHQQHNANMANFGGYSMPLWYPHGAKAEHLAVLQTAGLFDTSHMAVLTLSGNEALPLLQRCFSKDLTCCLGPKKLPLTTGRCVYGIFPDADGGVVDDALVYQCGTDQYMIVVNASMGATITELLRTADQNGEVTIVDHTDQVGKMDIQGPAAAKILSRILKDPDQVFDKMIYFSFKGFFAPDHQPKSPITLSDGTPIMVSRTGYTGEFGFELFVAGEHTAHLWHLLLEAGANEGLISCGLAARDSLRAGACLPLSHQDIGPWLFTRNPWTFVLPWNEDATSFTKVFQGADALLAAQREPWTLPFAGFDPRKITVSDKSYVADTDGEPIGTILTCTTDMGIDRVNNAICSIASPKDAGKPDAFAPRGLCCGFIRLSQQLPVGAIVVLTDGKRKIKVEIRNDIRPDRTARKAMNSMR